MKLVVLGKDGSEAILEEGSASYEGYLQMGYVYLRDQPPHGDAGDAVEAVQAPAEPATPPTGENDSAGTAPAQETEAKAADTKPVEAKVVKATEKS